MLYKAVVRPFLFNYRKDDPEIVHEWVLKKLSGLGKHRGTLETMDDFYRVRSPLLMQELMGLRFDNPVGLAAGFDKNAVAIPALAALGFGFLEIGTVPDKEQPGNPRPRIFRLPDYESLFNSMGFPSLGAEKVKHNLHYCASMATRIPLGVNIGKSKNTNSNSISEIIVDYLGSFERLFIYGDYFTICVSSPNTEGLRAIQTNGFLKPLLLALMQKNSFLSKIYGCDPKPILLKIDPDMSDENLYAVIDIVLECGLAGIVASNTSTNQARKLKLTGFDIPGGYSGPELLKINHRRIQNIRSRSEKLVIIGVGGVFNAENAYELLQAGANLIQIYTGFVYGGPGTPKRINRGLLRIKGFVKVRRRSPHLSSFQNFNCL